MQHPSTVPLEKLAHICRERTEVLLWGYPTAVFVYTCHQRFPLFSCFNFIITTNWLVTVLTMKYCTAHLPNAMLSNDFWILFLLRKFDLKNKTKVRKTPLRYWFVWEFETEMQNLMLWWLTGLLAFSISSYFFSGLLFFNIKKVTDELNCNISLLNTRPS